MAKARERKLWRILALQRPYKEAYIIARFDATERPIWRTVAMGLIIVKSEAKAMANIDWQSGLKDAMWSMFWFKDEKGSPDNEADKEELKKAVAWLIRATTQKVGEDAQRRGLKDSVDWKHLDTQIMNIVCLATSLCLHGEFGEMPEVIEE